MRKNTILIFTFFIASSFSSVWNALVIQTESPKSAKETNYLSVTTDSKNEKVTTFILTRHAEKENDGTSDPKLSEAGLKRAIQLSEMLSDTKIDKIISTPYKRTRETVRQIAEKAGLEIGTYDHRDKKLLSSLLKANEGGTIVISGHSNTIPVLVNQLTGSNKYAQLDEDEYDKLFIVSCTKVGNGSEVVLIY